MKSTAIYMDEISVQLGAGPDIFDITRELENLVQESRILDGILAATVIGSTGSLTTIEHEPGVVEDLKRAITRLAPPDDVYQHELAWHDGNGHSHIQAALLGPSLVLPVRNGGLHLGTWQQAVLVNHDNKARRRRVAVTLIGSRSG